MVIPWSEFQLAKGPKWGSQSPLTSFARGSLGKAAPVRVAHHTPGAHRFDVGNDRRYAGNVWSLVVAKGDIRASLDLDYEAKSDPDSTTNLRSWLKEK